MPDLTFSLKAYANFRLHKLNSMDPVTVQQQTLLKLINQAKNTNFGKDYNFENIKSVRDYQQRVPLRNYDAFWKDYWQKHFPVLTDITWPGTIPYFPVSSGTSTGTTKYLPFTKQMLASNKQAGIDLLVHHVANFPKSRLFSGKNFFLGGSTVLTEQAQGIFSGDLSGIIAKNIPFWLKPFYFPPAELALLSDWEEKIARFAEAALKEPIRLISGVPAWMLIFFNKLFELKPEAEGQLHKALPGLEVIVHGGVNFAPYYDQFQKLIAGSDIQLREVYPASEGFIAIGDRGYNQGLRLCLDNNIFYEFVPLEELNNPNPTRHWVGNIEKDVNYAVILSTCAGLWSYIIGDTVKFTDLNPPRLLVTGRTSYYLSAFGEHLIGEEIEDAVSTAAHSINATVSDFSVSAIYPQTPQELGGHCYVVEFSSGIPGHTQLESFAKILDQKLCARNEDYQAHRAEGFGLKAPIIKAVAPGTFSSWMKSRGKLGGQNKVPRIINSQELFKNLTDYCGLNIRLP